jgi:hypothetical protein
LSETIFLWWSNLHFIPTLFSPEFSEKVRLTLSVVGVPFEDKRVQFSEFGAMKASLPNGQLPVLEVSLALEDHSPFLQRAPKNNNTSPYPILIIRTGGWRNVHAERGYVPLGCQSG